MGLTVLKVEVGNPANPEVTEEANSNHKSGGLSFEKNHDRV